MNKIELNGRDFRLGLGFNDAALRGENISDGNIMNVPTSRLMFYSYAYAMEREGKDAGTIHDFFDWLDEQANLVEITTRFQIAFLNAMSVRLDDAGKKEVNALTTELEKKLKPQKKAAKVSTSSAT